MNVGTKCVTLKYKDKAKRKAIIILYGGGDKEVNLGVRKDCISELIFRIFKLTYQKISK